jgi:hypothetical protein
VGNGPTNATDPSGLLDMGTFENAFRERDPYAYDYWATKLHGQFVFTNYSWVQRLWYSSTGYAWWDERTLAIQLDISLGQDAAIDYAVKVIGEQGGDKFRQWLKDQPPSKAMVPLTGESVDEGVLPLSAFLPARTRYSKYAGLTTDEAIRRRQDELMRDEQFLGSTAFWDKSVRPYMEAYRVAAGELFPERYGALEVPFSARPPTGAFSPSNLNRMFGPDGEAYDLLPARGSRSGGRMLARRAALQRQRNSNGQYASGGTVPGALRHSRNSEYPHDFRKSVEAEVIRRHTNSKGQIIDPETGKVIPPDQVTIEHKMPVVEHWNKYGRNQTRAERVEWFNDLNNLTVKPASANKSDGAKLGQTFNQRPSRNYSRD